MRVLVDADALYALFLSSDPSHEAAIAVMRTLVKEDASLYISNLVVLEVATLLSYHYDQKLAIQFLDNVEKGGFSKIFIDETLTRQTWALFRKQTRKRTSFVDCSNVVAYEEMKCGAIFSFDKFYKKFKLNHLGG